ncbi:MAG TPA: prepilin-type N-terminal cleavage/methylation domain-containing protein [Verrucomicrobiae bacterium]|jgi:prepilin-type N-terminal cleavage/methylation domain-containing protein
MPVGLKKLKLRSCFGFSFQSSRLLARAFNRDGGQVKGKIRVVKGNAGFSLIEVTVALGLLGVFIVACLSAILTNQICDRKAKEYAIAMNFLTKYSENVKALPFTSVSPGLPINSIYNGVGGAPLIAIPTNNSWVSLNTTAFQSFYPDLLWLTNLNPTMQVNLTQNNVNGVLHDIEVNAKVNWTAPLAKGGTLEVQVDFLRTANVPTL